MISVGRQDSRAHEEGIFPDLGGDAAGIYHRLAEPVRLQTSVVFALSNFFMSAFTSQAEVEEVVEVEDELAGNVGVPEAREPAKSTLSYRFDVHDASVSILGDDQKSDTLAVRLTLSRLSLSQQVQCLFSLKRCFF